MESISASEPARRPPRAGLRLRSSILLKQTAFVAVMVVLTSGTLILSGHHFVRKMVADQINQRLILAASDRQVLLQTYLRQQQERIALVASRTRLRQLTDEYETGRMPRDEFRSESRRILVDAQKSSEGFLAISITDLTGSVITSTEEGELGKDYSADPAFLEGRQGKFVGLPRLIGANYRAWLAAPVTGNEQRFLGVAVVLLDIGPMVEFLTSTTGLGESGEILVGTRISDKVRLLLPTRHRLLTEVTLDEEASAMSEAIRGRTGFVQARDYRKVEVLAAFRPVGYRDWGLVAKIDVREAYAPLARLNTFILILEGSILLLGLISAFALAKKFTQPILELADSAAAVASGNLNVRAPVRSADELGTLARAFNRMTEQLASSYATLERRVSERTAQLEATSKELEAFSYSVSHDLRAPLRAIDGFSRIVMEDHAPTLDQGGREHLERIRAAAQRMALLIDDLLNLSRLARAELRREPIDLTGLAHDIATELRQSEPERKVEFVITDGMRAVGDPHLLRAALQNLLGNAWKFTGRRDRGRVEVGTLHQDGERTFFIRDNGAGFDMSYAGKLFGAFQRLHGTADFPGTGIGLASVQRIIHRHGGQVWATGEVDKGATFYFTLPWEHAPEDGARRDDRA
jgi:signal transduction histidine kinase